MSELLQMFKEHRLFIGGSTHAHKTTNTIHTYIHYNFFIWTWGSGSGKFPSQMGWYFRSDDWVSEGNWLTFLRLKALSSSFSTAWIFLTLMMQRASFPGKQKSFCHIQYVSRIIRNDSQKYQQPTVSLGFVVCVKICAPCKKYKI